MDFSLSLQQKGFRLDRGDIPFAPSRAAFGRCCTSFLNWPSAVALGRIWIVQSLEIVQDIIVVSICIGLFCSMLIQLWMMFKALLPPLNFSVVTSEYLVLAHCNRPLSGVEGDILARFWLRLRSASIVSGTVTSASA